MSTIILSPDSKIFQNREDAGKQLAKSLFHHAYENPIVVALPRGGVPVGYEIAKLLHAPLDVFVVRKIGILFGGEYGIGAAAEDELVILDEERLKGLGLTVEAVGGIIGGEIEEIRRRVALYRDNRRLDNLENKTVIIVDDGLATGVTSHAAIEGLRKYNPKKIIFVSPVCSYESFKVLKNYADEIICLATFKEFSSVERWYWKFDQLTDTDVINLLKKSKRPKSLKSKAHILM